MSNQVVVASVAGGNDMLGWVGIFSSEEKARESLLTAGCVEQVVNVNGADIPMLMCTRKFAEWLELNAKMYPKNLYSVHLDVTEMEIVFTTVDIDVIWRGYDDD